LLADDKGAHDSVVQWITAFDPNANQLPEIIGSPRSKLRFDQPYTWQVPAVDPDHDPLTFELMTAPLRFDHGFQRLAPMDSRRKSNNDRNSS
jgi:hypothetical protein